MLIKQCGKCLEHKPTSDFFRKGDGWQYQCKPCARVYYNTWRRTTLNRELVVECGGCGKRIERTYDDLGQPKKHCDHQCARRYHTLKQRGLTPADYEAMLAEQDGGCAICGTTEPKGSYGKVFAIDHCHATGKVRALLCAPCNQTLGFMRDDPALLRVAADYLERHAA